jgi:hypothetical protein
MTANSQDGSHHLSAQPHHEQAARFHREASRHFEAGKDFAHAAHQALIAHGHALQALEFELASNVYYVGLAARKDAPDTPSSHLHHAATESEGSTNISLSCAEHHTAAADLHEEACRHLSRIAGHFQKSKIGEGAREAKLALDRSSGATRKQMLSRRKRLEALAVLPAQVVSEPFPERACGL